MFGNGGAVIVDTSIVFWKAFSSQKASKVRFPFAYVLYLELIDILIFNKLCLVM